MGKYIPPERMTEAQIREEVNREFRRWNELAAGGCRDPHWPDGYNMNLVRNHIIYWYSLLREKMSAPVQLSLFGTCENLEGERPIPPEVPTRYMIRDGEYPNRLSEAVWPNLVWGRKGETMREYVTAYAQDKIKSLLGNELIRPEHKKRLETVIKQAVDLYERGTITTDEVMLLIAKV